MWFLCCRGWMWYTSDTWHIAAWVNANVLQNEGRMSNSVLDPSLLDPTNLTAKVEMLYVRRIALLCTREIPTDQPTMRDVAEQLKSRSQRMEMGGEIGDNEAREQTKIRMLPMETWKTSRQKNCEMSVSITFKAYMMCEVMSTTVIQMRLHIVWVNY